MLTAAGAAVALSVLGAALHVPLVVAVVLVLVYPFLLIPLGFYLPAELQAPAAARSGRALDGVPPQPSRTESVSRIRGSRKQ